MSNEDKDLREAFALFDVNGDGIITPAEVGQVLRAFGKNPSEAEIAEMIKEMGTDKLDFEKLKDLTKKLRKEDQSEVRDALKLFDSDNKGVINADHLREILATMGEKLDKKDIDMVISQVEENGSINVDKLVNLLVPAK